MELSKDFQHDLLLVVVGLLFIFFSTGLTVSTPTAAGQQPIVIP